MTEQKFQPYNKQPFNKQQSFFSKPNVPEKKIDESLVDKLFLYASEGNLLKLKSYVISNNLTLNVRKENGQNILHVIIDNSNINESQKIDLINFAINFGANINAITTGNITPLHLAAKIQSRKICELLIKNGANVNMLDSQLKSPLFYAIGGFETECPSTASDKPLIPENNDNIQKIKNITTQTYILLKHIFETDEIIIRYLTNIQNTIVNNRNIKLDILDDITSVKNNITSIIKNSDDNETKQYKIKDSIYSLKKKTNEYLKSKLTNTLNEYDIKQFEDGWSVTNDNKNFIVKDKSSTDILDKFNIEYNEIIKNSTSSFDNYVSEISNNLAKLTDYVFEVLRFTIQTLYNSFIIQHLYEMTQYYSNSNYNVTPLDFNPINMYLLFKEFTYDDNNLYVISDNKKYVSIDMCGELIELKSEYTNTTDYIYEFIDEPHSAYTIFNTINNSLQHTFQFMKTDIDPFNFFIEYLAIGKHILNNNTVADNKYIFFTYLGDDEDTIHDMFEDDYEIQDHPRNLPYLNSTILFPHHALSLLRHIIDKTKINNIDINDKQKYYEVIKGSNCSISSIALALKELKIEFEKVYKLKFENIKKIFESKKSELLDDFDIINKELEKVSSKLDENIMLIDNTYNILNHIIDDINICVKTADKINSINIIKNFTSVMNEKTYMLEDIYDNKLPQLNKLPILIDGIIDKIYLIENNALFIDNRNYNSYYSKNVVDYNNHDTPNIGYLSHVENVYDYYNEKNGTEKQIKLKYNNPIPNILDYLKNYFGYTGIKNRTEKNKKESLPDSIYTLFDEYFLILKYELIKYITNITYTTSYWDNINIFDYVKNEINDLTGHDNEDVLIFSFIAKIVDNYIIDNILSIINKFSNNIIEKIYLNNSILDIKIEEFEIDLQKKDIGFSMGVNDILDNYLVESNLSIIDDSHIIKNENNIHKIFDNSFTNKQNFSLCLNIDSSVVELLLSKKTYVNQQDILGNTPLYYACYIQHFEIIDLLKKYGCKMDFKNKSGKDIYSILWDIYYTNVIVKSLDIDTLEKISTEKIIKLLNKNSNYGNNIIRNIQNIIPIFIHILDNNFILLMCRYERNTDGMFLFYEKIKDYVLDYESETNFDLHQKNLHITSKNNEIIDNIDSNIYILDKKNKIEELISYNAKLGESLVSLQGKNTTKIQIDIEFNDSNIYPDSSMMYEKLANEIVKIDTNKCIKNTLSYQKSFNNYINNKKNKNDQLFNRYIKNIEERITEFKTDKDKLEHCKRQLKLIYYEDIFYPFSKQYFNLEQETAGINKPLTYVINIIIHVIKHFVVTSLYRVIIKTIDKYLSKIGSDYDSSAILCGKTNELYEYIVNKSPEKLVKSILLIYDQYDSEYNKKYTYNQFTNDINIILKKNIKLNIISDDNSLIQNLNKYIYPFYKDLIVNFTKELKDVADIFINNIINQYNYIKLINNLLKQ